MKKKPAPKPKKQAARFDHPPVYDEEKKTADVHEVTVGVDETPLQSEQVLNEAESAEEFLAAEETENATQKKEEEKEEVVPSVLTHIRAGKPPLDKGQKYFETADGRYLVGPHDAGSIDDPQNPGVQVNPWRSASIKHK